MDVVALDKLDKMFTTIQDASNLHGVIGVSDIINFLLNVYDPLTDHSGLLHNVNIPLTVDLILNWLLNVYDRYDSQHDTSKLYMTDVHTVYAPMHTATVLMAIFQVCLDYF